MAVCMYVFYVWQYVCMYSMYYRQCTCVAFVLYCLYYFNCKKTLTLALLYNWYYCFDLAVVMQC